MTILIISKYKDFYDHISYCFGVDEKIVYVRDTIKNVEIRIRDIPGYRMLRALNDQKYLHESVSIVVIVDKMYFVARNHSNGRDRALGASDLIMKSRYVLRDNSHNDSGRILNLSKLVGSPVYRINYILYDRSEPDMKMIAKIDKNAPRLTTIQGMVSLLDAQQVYQNIEYAIANQLNDSPDTSPRVDIEDKYKIAAAGFDLKQSFRHRK